MRDIRLYSTTAAASARCVLRTAGRALCSLVISSDCGIWQKLHCRRFAVFRLSVPNPKFAHNCAAKQANFGSGTLKRDEIGTNRHRALGLCLSMILSENRFTLFRIML